MEGTIVVPQRKDWDCGVASIAMLLNVPYADVSTVVFRTLTDHKKLKRQGIILYELEEIIGKFGFKTKRLYKKEGYLENATGILGLNGGDCAPHGHWVVIRDGMIIDPSGGEVWSPEDYMKAARCRPATMVVLT